MKNVNKLKFFIVLLMEASKVNFAIAECYWNDQRWLMKVLAFPQTKLSFTWTSVLLLWWVEIYGMNEMPDIATSLAGTGKRAGLLWQMARQSVGQPIDWAASGCDLCLPFLSHLKGEVSGSDRVMYKSSTWLVTPRWALYQPSSLSSCKKLHRKRWYLMERDILHWTVGQKTAWI